MSLAFPNRLVLSPLEGTEDHPQTRDGRSEWSLDQSFTYRTKAGRIIVVPAGFVTDLASVPRILTNAVPADGPWVKAAVIHDYLYSTKGLSGDLSRAQSDAVLKEAMEVLGVSRLYVWLIYLGVRAGGWKGWGS